MSMLRTIAVCLVMCVTPLAARETSGQTPARPQPGALFPVLLLPLLADARPASVAQFRGRKVLLHQFASW
jgi:hypothetical protein